MTNTNPTTRPPDAQMADKALLDPEGGDPESGDSKGVGVTAPSATGALKCYPAVSCLYVWIVFLVIVGIYSAAVFIACSIGLAKLLGIQSMWSVLEAPFVLLVELASPPGT